MDNLEQKFHVGIVSESSLEHASGVTRSVKEVTRHLMSDGHQVTITCPSPAPDEFGGAEVIPTQSLRLKGFDVGRRSRKDFQKDFGRLGIDMLHVASPMNTPGGALFLGGNAIRAASDMDVPTTAVYQTDAVRFSSHLGLGIAQPIIKKLLRDMHNTADINLVPSRTSMQDLIEWGVQPETIDYWGRGVDSDAFNPLFRSTPAGIALRETLTPNGEVLLGVVSRLEPEKRLHKLKVVTDIPNTKLLVVGKGTEQKHLQDVLGKKAIFTGRLDGDDLSAAYAVIDTFLFPSVTDTFAQVVQEAKASGVPVIAANRGGPRDLVEHGVTGFLYEPARKEKDDSELREYANHLVTNHEVRAEMGRRARMSVEGRTWKNLVCNDLVGQYVKAAAVRQRKVRTAV